MANSEQQPGFWKEHWPTVVDAASTGIHGAGAFTELVGVAEPLALLTIPITEEMELSKANNLTEDLAWAATLPMSDGHAVVTPDGSRPDHPILAQPVPPGPVAAAISGLKHTFSWLQHKVEASNPWNPANQLGWAAGGHYTNGNPIVNPDGSRYHVPVVPQSSPPPDPNSVAGHHGGSKVVKDVPASGHHGHSAEPHKGGAGAPTKDAAWHRNLKEVQKHKEAVGSTPHGPVSAAKSPDGATKNGQPVHNANAQKGVGAPTKDQPSDKHSGALTAHQSPLQPPDADPNHAVASPVGHSSHSAHHPHSGHPHNGGAQAHAHNAHPHNGGGVTSPNANHAHANFSTPHAGQSAQSTHGGHAITAPVDLHPNHSGLSGHAAHAVDDKSHPISSRSMHPSGSTDHAPAHGHAPSAPHHGQAHAAAHGSHPHGSHAVHAGASTHHAPAHAHVPSAPHNVQTHAAHGSHPHGSHAVHAGGSIQHPPIHAHAPSAPHHVQTHAAHGSHPHGSHAVHTGGSIHHTPVHGHAPSAPHHVQTHAVHTHAAHSHAIHSGAHPAGHGMHH